MAAAVCQLTYHGDGFYPAETTASRVGEASRSASTSACFRDMNLLLSACLSRKVNEFQSSDIGMRELAVFFELWTKPFGIFRCFLTERFNDKYIHSFILRRQDSRTDGGAIIEEYNFGGLVLGGEN